MPIQVGTQTPLAWPVLLEDNLWPRATVNNSNNSLGGIAALCMVGMHVKVPKLEVLLQRALEVHAFLGVVAKFFYVSLIVELG